MLLSVRPGLAIFGISIWDSAFWVAASPSEPSIRVPLQYEIVRGVAYPGTWCSCGVAGISVIVTSLKCVTRIGRKSEEGRSTKSEMPTIQYSIVSTVYTV